MELCEFKKYVVSLLGFIGVMVAASNTAAQQTSVDSCLADHVAAQERKLDGRLLEARARLRSCAQSICPGQVAQECQQLLSEVEPRIPSIVPIVRDGEGRDVVEGTLTIDGEVIPEANWGRPREVDPGAHELTMTRDQHVVARIKIVVIESEKSRRVEIRVEGVPQAPPTGQTNGLRIAGIVGASVGGAALIGGSIFGALARVDYGALASSCAPHCTEDVVSGVRQKALVADVLFGSGIALGIAGTLVAILPGKSVSNAQPRSAWVPVVLPTERGITVGVVGQWF